MGFRLKRVISAGQMLFVAGMAMVAFTVSNAPASAGEKSFFVGTTGVTWSGSTDFNGAIKLNTGGDNYFGFNFQLPADYKPNSTVRIVFYGETSNILPCAIWFAPSEMSRSRKGETISFSLAGMRPKGGKTMKFTEEYVTAAKTFLLKPGSDFSGQKPGDFIWLQVRRNPAQASDTCSAVYITGILIRYTTPKK